MDENNRNSSLGILILFLMIVLFSFIQREKERHITGSSIPSSVISNTNSSSPQTIIDPVISTPGISFHWINTRIGNFRFLDCTTNREIIFNKQISIHYSSCQLKFISEKPIIILTFRQKVPAQKKSDDILPVT